MSLIWILLLALLSLIINQGDAFYIKDANPHNRTELLSSKELESPISPLLNDRTVFTTGAYVWQNFYELHQFEDAPERNTYENIVHSSIFHCMAILLAARKVFSDQYAATSYRLPTNPSMLRYGPTNILAGAWLPNASLFIQRWLDVLGWAPMNSANNRAQCLHMIDKLQFWYDDPPKEIYDGKGCGDQGPNSVTRNIAYFFRANPGKKNGVVFCTSFFENYRSMDSLDNNQFGEAIEFGDRHPVQEPTYFTAKILLHELMHYSDVYKDIFKTPFGGIVDIRLRDPEGDTWVAYGPFMAMKAKDSTWDWLTAQQPPQVISTPHHRHTLANSDSWVYMLIEIYLKHKFPTLPDWKDPPDNRAFGIGIPQDAPPSAAAPASSAGAQIAPNRVADIAAASQSSPTIKAGGFDVTYNEVPATELPTDDGFFSSTATYAPECPLCQVKSIRVHAKVVSR